MWHGPSKMSKMSQANNPLHGVKLAHMVEALVEYWGLGPIGPTNPREMLHVRPFCKIGPKVPKKDALGAF